MHLRKFDVMASVGVVLAVAGLAGGQTDPLYMNGDWSDTMHVVQGGVVIDEFPIDQGAEFQTALAVAGDIRTVAAYPGNFGAKYGLGGGYLGQQYLNACGQTLIDGGTDGVNFNYSVGWLTGDVLRFNRQWAHHETIFSVGTAAGGITFDQSTQSLWITESFGSATVYHYDLAGSLLGTFETFASDLKSIAWEPSTDTLWINSRDDDVLWQCSKTGDVLKQVSCNIVDNVLGMEFSMGIPAPGAGLLLCMSGLIAARRRCS